MKKIVYTRPDGGLSIVTPIINTHPVPEDITESQAILRAWDKLPKDAINPRFVDESEIPTDRTFRNAWEDNGAVSVNMPKAREIHRQIMRYKRAPMLSALDIDYQRADERGDSALKAEIAVRKQALRDVTADPAIESATTPEELKAVIPSAFR